MKILEKFGIKPNNIKLFETAFIHSSYASKFDMEHNYERLEFLGDSVLSMIVSNYLFELFPDYGEGKLTKIRSNYVCQSALEVYSKDLGLDKYIKVNLEDSHISDHEILSISADIFESFLGAIVKVTGIVSVDAAKKSILDSVPKGTEDKNIQAFEAGYNLV